MYCLCVSVYLVALFYFFFQAEDGIRDYKVTGVQTCALPICLLHRSAARPLPITVHNAQLTSPVWRSAAPIAILSHSARDGSARPPWVQSVATIEFPGKKRQHLSMVFHFLLRTLAAVILRGLLRIHQAYPRQRELLPQVALVAVDRIYFERPLRLVPDISRHVAAYAEHSGC